MKTKIPYSGQILDSPRHLLFRKIFISTGLKQVKSVVRPVGISEKYIALHPCPAAMAKGSNEGRLFRNLL